MSCWYCGGPGFLAHWLLSSFSPDQFLKTKRKHQPSCCQTQIIIKTYRRVCRVFFVVECWWSLPLAMFVCRRPSDIFCHLGVGLVSKYSCGESELVHTHLITHRPIKKWCNGAIDPLITNFNTMWWWVVHFTCRPLYSQDPGRSLDGAQIQPEHFIPAGNGITTPQTSGPLVTVYTELSVFQYMYVC